MACREVKHYWILAIFVLAVVFLCDGLKHDVTFLALEGGQPYGSGSEYSGRVVIQLNHEGVNGSICASSWTDADASVVCAMLGFRTGKAADPSIQIAHGNSNFLMGNLNCTGSETSITQCPGADHVITCVYGDQEVAVHCEGGAGSQSYGSTGFSLTTQTPISVATAQPTLMYSICAGGTEKIRLLGREGTKSMGLVQVYVNEMWQFICDDSWDQNDARVICSELFCHSNSTDICARPAAQSAYLPDIFYPIKYVPYGIQCDGTEKSIFDCHKVKTMNAKNCKKEELAGVQCEENPLDTPPSLEAVLDCKDPSGNMKITFPSGAFPGITEANLNILYKSIGSPSCDTSVLARRSDNADLSVMIPLGDCGTRTTNNGSHFCYENVVEYRHQVASVVLTESRRKEFTIQCCVGKVNNVNIHFLPEEGVVKNTLSQSFDYKPELNFCQDETCTAPISASPYSVSVGQWVYMGVSLPENQNLTLSIANCTLDFIGGLNQTESRALIENRCPIEVTNVTIYNTSNALESFRFKAFKLEGYSSAYVTCQVHVCLTTEINPQCDRSCASPTGGRRRRETSSADHHVIEVVSHALNIQDVDTKTGDAASKDKQRDFTVRKINPRFFKP